MFRSFAIPVASRIGTRQLLVRPFSSTTNMRRVTVRIQPSNVLLHHSPKTSVEAFAQPQRRFMRIPDELDGLMDEHTIITNVCDALIGYVTLIDQGEPVDKGDLKKFVTFFRGYVIQGHFQKEDDFLFEGMINNNPSQHGIIPVLEKEHKQVQELCSTLDGLTGDNWDDVKVIQTAAQLVDLIDQHFKREEGGLFPMVANKMDKLALEQLGARFEEMEVAWLGKEKKTLEKMADELREKYPWQPDNQ